MMNHEFYIVRCLELAKKGIGTTRPNPSVGAVIVHNNKIIGEGFTSPYGGPHAEVNAINAVQNQELLKEATIYVTLEPCSHHGKTPPCADLIIEKGIPNIVIGCVDTNSLVAGKGIERLKKASRNVIVGVCQKDCIEHHRRFFTVQNKKRPYIILKWAETKDGFIAPLTKDEQKPVWISNQYSQQLVHKWRSEEHAILVGTNTVIADNPSLTVRDWKGNNPIRIVIDKNLRIPSEVTVFDGNVKTIIVTEEKKEENQHVIYEQIDFSFQVAEQICEVLYKHQIQSVIIEGGAKTLQTFIDANLWDEARVFIGDVVFGEGVKHPIFNAKLSSEEKIDNDTLRIYRND
ncbi:bifunctional diaminohydroxyphosphoribosylaminopyrimidine deaminase/5-amino-6-(5-phosphoribosylamino)uracil reductase RibD [Tenacibaculum singaporense]|uniref:bifunctional diaminohydroxyphosphoribosylaminopyrimidine deaminase/5-amino-6-(5-phosphoribosylamino)uracil reductase RibD n=1 Tax=Tenacibaculum singaporense TaxID=2358479 RepID=UPI000F65AB1E|nr:bifunctional diaminohydroxyphosphoribosylaminopyrimidine deaminase/5-amino-6-(5-phosphoribosylamino)uracil reductase RibD [Tenacibaculum singaporense]RSC93081.1 bifunctional diaminohydroxyphosphoribosylaminopyrimidine deaminase/5-amino-6-(5-phosphoribosylamino)uracil reductase RibD [Tenacibaculum singaporense]